jgi:hypothetical protein
MLKKLGPARFGGDDNVCELTRVCPTCQGTRSVPPNVARNGDLLVDDCAHCTTGVVVQRFKTLEELKAFIEAL